MPNNPDLKTVLQFSEENPAFPVGGLRWQIFNEGTNGLKDSGAIVRVGRRVLINTERYFDWIESQQQIKTSNSAALNHE